MPDARPLAILCITTYEKGQEFMRQCKRQGCRVILLTAEKLRDADWPRESLDNTFYLPDCASRHRFSCDSSGPQRETGSHRRPR